jgi:hypothetical protein
LPSSTSRSTAGAPHRIAARSEGGSPVPQFHAEETSGHRCGHLLSRDVLSNLAEVLMNVGRLDEKSRCEWPASDV